MWAWGGAPAPPETGTDLEQSPAHAGQQRETATEVAPPSLCPTVSIAPPGKAGGVARGGSPPKFPELGQDGLGCAGQSPVGAAGMGWQHGDTPLHQLRAPVPKTGSGCGTEGCCGAGSRL